MYVDSQLELSDSQAVTSTAISSNVIDLLAPNSAGPNLLLDIGQGESLYLFVATVVAATDTGSDATLTLTLETDTAVGLGSSTVLLSSGPIPFATFSPAGARLLAARIPAADFKRYLGLRYTVANGPLTAGAFDAVITSKYPKSPILKSGWRTQ